MAAGGWPGGSTRGKLRIVDDESFFRLAYMPVPIEPDMLGIGLPAPTNPRPLVIFLFMY
jgi:hypothetical protein